MQQAESIRKAEHIVLLKGERREIGRAAIIFKGLEKKTILFDLYLLDLDPQQPYEKKITKADAKEGFYLGNDHYFMISVNNGSFVIKPFDQKPL